MVRKKWFWAAVCFLGIGRIAVNWTTGAIGFTPIWVGIPPAGAVMVPLYSPWFVYASFPIGAVIFLIRRSSLTEAKALDFPEAASTGSPLKRSCSSYALAGVDWHVQALLLSVVAPQSEHEGHLACSL